MNDCLGSVGRSQGGQQGKVGDQVKRPVPHCVVGAAKYDSCSFVFGICQEAERKWVKLSGRCTLRPCASDTAARPESTVMACLVN